MFKLKKKIKKIFFVFQFKNLTPILTKMTREIDNREKELTLTFHRCLLVQHLEQVKSLTPSFISSIKINLLITKTIQANKKNSQIYTCIEDNRDFLTNYLSQEINQIIRILQYTSYEDEECDESLSDDLNMIKQKFVILFENDC